MRRRLACEEAKNDDAAGLKISDLENPRELVLARQVPGKGPEGHRGVPGAEWIWSAQKEAVKVKSERKEDVDE